MIRVTAALLRTTLLGATLLLAGTACGPTRPSPVPDVTGERLDLAENRLDALGLRYRATGGGAFGIVVRSHWFVCSQDPAPGTVATTVVLAVARSCAMPDLVGMTLEDAADELDDAGIAAAVHSLDGERILAESLWTVCEQSPRPGAAATKVDLYVSHECLLWRAA